MTQTSLLCGCGSGVLFRRYRLYTKFGERTGFADIEHEPWPLQAAKVVRLEQNVVEESGVPQPSGDLVVHFSRRLEVRIGRLRLAG